MLEGGPNTIWSDQMQCDLCLAGGKEIILLDIKFRDKRVMGNLLER